MGPFAQVALVIGLLIVWIAIIYGLEKSFMRADGRRERRANARSQAAAGREPRSVNG